MRDNWFPGDGGPPAAVPAAEPVAIIGMSCRLPGADDPRSFWRLLRDGVDAVTEAPDGRWPAPAGAPRPRGGFVGDIEGFDAAFFGLSPREAAASDPHQRLMLELAWEALEGARIIPGDLRGTPAGVFVGAISTDFAALRDRLGASALDEHGYPGSSRALIANRVSYLMGLSGPSLTVDTGQSSSLVAVGLACQSLGRGESDLALAGGVNLNLLAETTQAIGRFGALSPDGRCRVFDAAADGYVRGEGGGVVVLKPLRAALRDGDLVHCVILGGAVNSGAGDGITAPSRPAQEQVIAAACARAGVNPADVQYVELHGTGTRAGDPVEAAALGAVLGRGRPAARPLLVGSVKTNIGHLEGAAGIAGLLKVALSIAHRELPPSLHFSTPNPAIQLNESRLRVVTDHCPWPGTGDTGEAGRPLVAGVSSFGMGGTNCHLLLGPAPATEPGTSQDRPASAPVGQHPVGLASAGANPAAAAGRAPDRGAASGDDFPWTLSARSRRALGLQAGRLRAALDETPAAGSDLVARSLIRTRTAFEHRAVITRDHRAGLAALAEGRAEETVIVGSTVGGRLVFTFPGQGSQWPDMARDLLETSPAFAGQIEECAAALAPFVDYSLPEVLRAAPGAPALDRVDVVQPALWATMVSLAALWRASGVTPDAVIGHSQGEIAAATVIGALSLSDGARVVALRAKAIAALAGSGGMLSVAAPPEAVEEAITAALAARFAPRTVSIAAVNGPRSVVVSGPTEVLEIVERHVKAIGYRAKTVPVDYASHSPAVERLREEILTALGPVRPTAACAEFISALTGQPIDTTELTAAYWYASLRQPVQFGRAVETALPGGGLFIECSPHPVLVGAVEEAIEHGEHAAAVVATLRRDDGGLAQFRRSLAQAYVHGASVDWTGQDTTPSSALADLPTYAFARRRYPLIAATRTIEQERAEAGREAMDRPPGTEASPLATDSTAPTRGELRYLVRRVTASILGYGDPADIAPDRTFKDLGLGSAAAIELRNRLRAATGHPLGVDLVYHYPTPAQVSEHLFQLGSQERAPRADRAATGAGRRNDGRRGHAEQGAEEQGAEPVAIVGIGCRYPGGITTPEELWDLVISGRDAVGDFPADRGWDLDLLFSGDPGRRSATRRGGFLTDASGFDAGFFGISPREALAIDPQQRILLETCWEALEHGGLDPHALRGSRTGVFVGAMGSDYGPRLDEGAGSADGHRLTGSALSVASGRIAYTLGLLGPVLTVDTACSSSLVATHLAVQALRRGECELALAGGVTVMASPGIFVEFSRQGGLAPDGRCKAFSATADGTGWAEGAGVLALMRLSDARRGGHRVLALIRGTAVNSDGRSNGLTAPSGPAQERVITQALADAGLAAADVDAVEAHGTGTVLGDPIEANALLAAYGRDRQAGRPLWLGSLKSNIGHTQAAAGVAGIIKLAMAMRHRTLPPTLHVTEPTPHVDWSAGGVRLLTGPVPWPGAAGAARPAVAAVSSFGISGTNAHLVLEEPPAVAAEPDTRAAGGAPAALALAMPEPPAPELTAPEPAVTGPGSPRPDPARGAPLVWVISARTEAALRAQASRLRAFAVDAPQADLPAAGLALLRRARFAHRAVIIADGRSELTAALTALADGTPHPGLTEGVAPAEVRPVLVFPGQGSQWPGMAADLLDSSPAFRAELLRCDAALAPHTGWSVASVLRGAEGAPALAGSDVIQPALFAVMASLAAMWRAAGVRPAAVLGHSQGELTAAYAAGVLALPDAARIVALRAVALMKLTGTGGMIAVQAPAGQVADLIAPWDGRLWLAIESGPSACVVAGDADALDEFAAATGDRPRLHRVAIDYAAHTPHMESLREELLAITAGTVPRPTETAFCSSLTGELTAPEALTGDYWYLGLRHQVRFAEAVATLAAAGSPLFIEASPHPVLTGHVSDVLRDRGQRPAAAGTLRRGCDGPRQFLKAAAQAFTLGADIDWPALLGPSTALAAHAVPVPGVDLPGYPFERQRFWLASTPVTAPAAARGTGSADHPLLSDIVPLADGGCLLTGRVPGLAASGRLTWLADHAIGDDVLVPGTAFVELASQAAAAVGCDVIEELIIESPLRVSDDAGFQLQVQLTAPGADQRRRFTVHARQAAGTTPESAAAPWTRHASGSLGVTTTRADHFTALTAAPGPGNRPSPGTSDASNGSAAAGDIHAIAAWPPPGSVPIDLGGAYARLAARGYHYGPAFRGLIQAWRAGQDTYAEVALPGPVRAEAGRFTIHPALLDAALHPLLLEAQPAGQEADGQGPAGNSSAAPGGDLLLPFSWGDVRLTAFGADALRVHVTRAPRGVSLACYDQAGRPVATIGALTLRAVPAPSRPSVGPALHTVGWESVPAQGRQAPATAALTVAPGLSAPPAPAEGTGLAGRRLAVVGADTLAERLAAVLGAAGADVAHYYDLPSVADLAGDAPPDDVLATCGTSASDVPAALREAAGTALDLVQTWLGDERFAGRRLTLVTSGAVAAATPAAPGTRPETTSAEVDSLAAAAVWGLARSAQREHPGRFALLDVTGDPQAAAVASALASGEPQLALPDATMRVPRLTRHEPVTQSAAVGGAAPGASAVFADGAVPGSGVIHGNGSHPHAGAGFPGDEVLPGDPALPGAGPAFPPDGTVLVTGGTGGLGGLVAERLAARHGVRHLVLASRRGPGAPGAAELAARLAKLGAKVTLAACDVGDRAALAALLASIPAAQPLVGVVHAAGVVDDVTVERLSASQLDTVLRAKADAAWHLSELTSHLPLSAFVLFSSVAGQLGSPGQANYAAANAALDALAGLRDRSGLPAVSIAWGPWDASAGMTARLREADLARMARAGLAPLSAGDGLDLFDRALTAGRPVVLAAHWTAAGQAAADGARQPGARPQAQLKPTAAPTAAPMTSHERQPETRPGAGAGSGEANGAAAASAGLPGRLAAMAADEARRLLTDLVRSHAAAVLGYPAADAIDVRRAVSDLGLDSLTAVELRNRLDAATGLRLSATLAFDHPTVTALADYLYRELIPAPAPPEDTLRAALDQVEQSWPEPDDATRSKVTAILHSALSRWEAGPLAAGGPLQAEPAQARTVQARTVQAKTVHDKISAASDDEIFALLDNEI